MSGKECMQPDRLQMVRDESGQDRESGRGS